MESPINSIKIKRALDDAIIPAYQHKGDAGFDLHSAEDIIIESGMTSLVTTGLIFEVPEGYELQVRSRSGLALKNGIFVLNGVGTVDSSYRGQVGVILTNAGKQTFSIRKGDRIAQGVINKIECPIFMEVEEVTVTDRGERAFGSTGVN
jgi:dUTP pyrophosphatase